MNPIRLIVAGVVLLVVAFVVTSAAFIVHQTEQAIVLRFGNPKQVIQEPGLSFKVPFVDDVTYFDARILDYAPPQEEIIAADQKRLVVDSFARYRIADPLEFYKSVGTELSARARLAGIMSASLRRVVGNETLTSVLSEERNDIMERIRTDVNEAASKFGIEVVDVRIRRADLPQANANAIYQRMQTEREREAKEFRAQGEEVSLRIRARADRERTVLIAESQRQSQVLRGEGDSEAIRIYAEAFGKDPEFFAFYRSMEAYRKALANDGTTMVLSPNSDFFSYFGQSAGNPMFSMPSIGAPEMPANDNAPAVPGMPATDMPATDAPATGTGTPSDPAQ
jgi:membrane protease subunit HflC